MMQTVFPLVLVVRRVAGLDAILTDQTAIHFAVPHPATKLRVVRGGLAVTNNGRMGLKQADDFLDGGHGLPFHHASERLTQDLVHQAAEMFQRGRQGQGARAADFHQQGTHRLGVVPSHLRHPQQTPIEFSPRFLGILALFPASSSGLKRNPAGQALCLARVVTKEALAPTHRAPIRDGAGARQGASQDPHAIGQQPAVGRIMNVGLHHRTVSPHFLAAREAACLGLLHRQVVECMQGGRPNQRLSVSQRGEVRHGMVVNPTKPTPLPRPFRVPAISLWVSR